MSLILRQFATDLSQFSHFSQYKEAQAGGWPFAGGKLEEKGEFPAVC